MGIGMLGGISSSGIGITSTNPLAGTARFWRLEVTAFGSNGTAISELKMTFDASSNLLDSFTLTSIGGTFSEEFTLAKINDTIAEIVNADSIGFVPIANGFMDFYVDFGVGNEKDVSVYSVAPQGTAGSNPNNALVGFNAHKSNNAVDWTLVKSFSDITTTFPDWNPGTFRDFDLT